VNNAPLVGLSAIVTSPKETASSLTDGLAGAGAEVILAPLISIDDPESWGPLDSALEQLASGAYSWLVVPSTNSARSVIARLGAAGLRPHPKTRVATVGPSTARDLEHAEIAVSLTAVPHTSKALVEAIGRGTGRILLPRVVDGPREFADALASRGWDVHEVTAYRNVPAGPASSGLDRVESGDFDVITLTSASAARGLAAHVPPSSIGLQAGGDLTKTVACIGPSTAAAARAAGLRVDVVARDHTVSGLVEAIIDHVRGMAR
jgi:uroporphyrinogen-III synthase